MRIRHVVATLSYIKEMLNQDILPSQCIKNKIPSKDFLISIEIDPFNRKVHFYFLTEDNDCPMVLEVEGMPFSKIETKNPVFRLVRS